MECGYQNATTIWSIIAKKKKPSTPTLNKICNAFPNVNRRWLISGNESMFINEPRQPIQELTVTAKQIIDYLSPLIPVELENIDRFYADCFIDSNGSNDLFDDCEYNLNQSISNSPQLV